MHWRDSATPAGVPRAALSHGGARWALKALVKEYLTITRDAASLGVAMRTANTAALALVAQALINSPARFDGVTTTGVDEHVWRHTRYRIHTSEASSISLRTGNAQAVHASTT